jgi:hypothetical protein
MTTNGGNDGRQLDEDQHVSELLPDPSREPSDIVGIIGFLGKSPIAGRWRIYLDPELTRYYEVNEDSILASQRESGQTIVWLKKGTKAEYTRATSLVTQAEFLQGDIASLFHPTDADLRRVLGTESANRLPGDTTLTICFPSVGDVCWTESWGHSTIISFCPAPNSFCGCTAPL